MLDFCDKLLWDDVRMSPVTDHFTRGKLADQVELGFFASRY